MNAWFEIRIYYIKSWTRDLKSGFIISNHERVIWNQDLLYQIINYDLKSGLIISNHDLVIWNQDLLYQIINLWFEIKIYYIKS